MAVVGWIPFLALPFVVFYWLLPFASAVTLGPDYQAFPIREQLALQLSLRSGTFPLFVPEFEGGISASALTMGQLFHPLPHLAARIPGYWSGHALEIVTVLNLLSLGVAHRAAFGLVRGLGLDRTLSAVLSFVAVYNLRMLDLFRYGASLQNYVGYVLLCVAVGRLALGAAGYRALLFVVLAAYLLVCGGHPQMAYLGGLGAALFTLVVPFFLPALGVAGRREGRDVARFYARAFGAMGVGILLSAAYLLPFYADVLTTNALRVDRTFRWVYWPYGTPSFTSLLHSVMKPFWSGVEGSFGGSSLFLLPLLAPLLSVAGRLPRVVLATWSLVLLVLLLVLAETFPLYYLFWKLAPLASSFRTPGRVTMMLPFLLLLLLAWELRRGEARLDLGRGRTVAVGPLLGIVAAAVFAAYNAVSWDVFEAKELTAPIHFHAIPEIALGASFALGLAALLLVAAYLALRGRGPRAARVVSACLVVVVVAQVTLSLRYGAPVVAKPSMPTAEEMARQQARRIGYHGPVSAGFASRDLVEHRRHRTPFRSRSLARLFFGARSVGSREEAYRVLAEAKDHGRAVVEGLPAGALAGARRGSSGEIRLVHGTFNTLRFAVRSMRPAVLVTNLPFTGHWRALVDGEAARIYRANGLFVAVLVPAGQARVELTYASTAAAWGMALSLTVGALLAIGAALRVRSPVWRVAGVAASVLVALSLYASWDRSRQGGESLATKPVWSSEPGGVRAPVPRS